MEGQVFKHHFKRKRSENGATLKRTFWVGVIDTVIYPIGFISVLMASPQVYDVWVMGQTEGVSLITWASWTVISVAWFLYGLVHRAYALMFIHTSWFFMHLAVTLGILVNS